MKKWNRKILFTAAAAAVIAGGVRQSIAYFTDTETKTNVFTMGDLDIGLREPEWDPEPDTEDGIRDGRNMYPGYTVYKNPTIKNITTDKNGEEPCYARMRMYVSDQDGKQIEDEEILGLISQMIYFDSTYDGTYDSTGKASRLVEGRKPGYSLSELSDYPMINPMFEKDEERSGAGMYVYNYIGSDGEGILYIGDEAALFTNIIVPTDWSQEQIKKIGDFKLEIEAECIQSSGFETKEEALRALDQEMKEVINEKQIIN